MVRPVGVELRQLNPETPAFSPLLQDSQNNGFRMLVRLLEGWQSGQNRFARSEEMLIGAWQRGDLLGVCGLNVDPYVEGRREGRVRHLYVSAEHRRGGIGRLLVTAIIDKAGRHFPVVNTRAPVQARPFYERLGFRPVQGDEFVTHRLMLDKNASTAL